MGDYAGNKQLYAAFLSYAHEDDAIAQRVQKSLETYALPKNLKQHADRLSPIFRDVTELIASHSLTDRITDAVENSRFLIVLCSPASKASHWVNEEIRLFRRLHGEESIFCALIEGSPATSFPPALTEDGREPLAADMTGQKESFKFGITQMAASMLNVGLDDLILRKRQRYRRRVMLITASAITALLMMGALTWTAMDARQLAEQRRVDAEGQIEFMLTELKDELEAVGRLSALQAVGDRAAAYYDSYKLSDHDDDALGRRAKVYHYLGEIQDKLGNQLEANRYFHDAYLATEELLERDPDNPDRIFDHSQSAYWVGSLQYGLGNYDATQQHFQFYLDMANRLQEVEGNTERAQQELAYAYGSLGSFELDYGDIKKAVDFLEISLSLKESIFKNSSRSRSDIISLFKGYRNLSNTALRLNDLEASIKYLYKSNDLLQNSEADAEYNFLKLENLRSVLHLYYINGNKEIFNSELEKAKELIERLVEIDSRNLDYQFEISFINIIEYEFLFSTGQTSSLELLKEEIEIGYSKLKKADDKNSNLIEFLLINIRVFHSLINDENPSQSINLLKKTLDSLKITSSSHIKKHPYVLPSIVLLQNWQENDTYVEIINQLCNDQQINLNYVNRVILNASPAIEDCPIAVKQIHQNSISKAAELFSKFNREKKNDR